MAETVIMPDGSGMGFGSGAGVWGVLLGALLGQGGLFGGRGYGYGSPAAGAVASEVVLTPTLNAIQNQISNLSNEIDTNALLAGITSVNQNISGTSRDIGRDIAALSTAQAAGNFTTLNSINGLGRDITASQTQALINNLQNFNTLQASLTTSTNQIISQGTALASQLAECCCEIKQTVKDDGNATRALINDLNVQNLRDQLAAANGKVSNFEQNQYLVNTIVNHLKPVVS